MNEFNFEHGKKEFSKEEIKKVSDYLRNPVSEGIWGLKITINLNKGIFKHISDEIEYEFDNNEKIEISSWEKPKRVINTTKKNRTRLIAYSKKIGFLFTLFSYIKYLEVSSNERFMETIFDDVPLDFGQVIQILDIDNIKEKYREAYDYFSKEFFCDNITVLLYLDRIMRISDGFYVMSEMDVDKKRKILKLIFFSIKNSTLKRLKKLFEMVDIIDDSSLLPIYSPEEEVFAPYFSLLTVAYEDITGNKHIRELLEKAIKEYKDKDYNYCISTIGLVVEDYLIQVYETLFRKVSPEKATIGQTFDLINSKIKDMFKPSPESPPDMGPIYNRIKELLNKKKKSDNEDIDIEILKLTRKIFNYMKENSKNIKERFSLSQKQDDNEKYTVFPKSIRGNINEVLKYRNAIAHKSRVPIGNYEALRAMYCCVTFIMWWVEEKENIDWSKSKLEIIKESVKRNNDVKVGE